MRSLQHRDDRGAVIVFFMIVLVVLLSVTALTIDLGIGRAKKRQTQNGADAASLGAAQHLVPSATGPASLANAESEAHSLEGANVTDFQSGGWNGCVDSGAGSTDYPNLGPDPDDCVSFDTSFMRVRVRTPSQGVDTLFARIFDFNQVNAAAVAEAGIFPAGQGGVLPFGLYSTFNAPEGCLKTNPNGQVQPDPPDGTEPCEGSATGNFGFLDIRQYGNANLQTVRRGCGSDAQQDDRTRNNIAIGVDHVLTVYAGTNVYDDQCEPLPNTLEVKTGNQQNPIDAGLISSDTDLFDDAGKGRLLRGAFAAADSTLGGDDNARILGERLDNQPLWEFIPPGTDGSVPPSCQRDQFDTMLALLESASAPDAVRQYTMNLMLDQCFIDYAAGSWTGAVFDSNTDPFGDEGDIDLYDIQLTSRFAYIPQLTSDGPPPGGSAQQTVLRFRAVYLQRLQAGCSGNQGGGGPTTTTTTDPTATTTTTLFPQPVSSNCNVDFEPGPWNDQPQNGQGASKVDSLTSYVFPVKNGQVTMLPGELGTNPFLVGESLRIQLIR